jgi:methionyl-tRNA formyltransferase
MRLAFMGSPDFAVTALKALVAAGHEIACVYAQPPRPAGRGQKLHPCPVHAAALALGLPVRTPAKLRKGSPGWEEEWAFFRALDLDCAVVAAYGLILPAPILAMPRRGCLNIHASLLPRWRGAAPIQAAILAGDAESGVTIMQMDAGLDTGDMLLKGAVPITATTTAPELHDALAEIGARLVLRALTENPSPVKQPEEGVTYAAKLARDDGLIDWTRPTAEIDRQIRALNPWPGTFTHLGEEVLKIHAATPCPGSGAPGRVLDDELLVATGDGALRLVKIQAPGRAAMTAEAFLNGRKIPPGTQLGAAPDHAP